MLSYETWAPAVFGSVMSLSRTARGFTEEAYDGAKPPLQVTDPVTLTACVETNLRRAIAHVWAHGPGIRRDPLHLQSFMNTIAKKTTAGLLHPGQDLFRTWETRKKLQVLPGDIAQEYRIFCENLSRNLEVADPVALAAEVEREIDGRIHPFADGCGRVARLLGAWVLLRSGLPPAQFASRKEYYAALDDASWEDWVRYYGACIPVPQSA